MNCPNANCGKRFYAVQDAIRPGTASLEDFFKFVNHTETGRISKEELVDWYTTNFDLTRENAMSIVDSNWHMWDMPKNRSFLKGGWFRSKDQGDLDMDEFPAVQKFMEESLVKSLVETRSLAVSGADSTERRGQKRNSSDADTFLDGVGRNVAQRQMIQSEGLLHKLCCNANKGRAWFDYFDSDRSGGLEKGELISALLQTFVGSQHVPHEQVTSIVHGIWETIDTDGSGSVDFEEFQMLREALMAELNKDTVVKASGRMQTRQ